MTLLRGATPTFLRQCNPGFSSIPHTHAQIDCELAAKVLANERQQRIERKREKKLNASRKAALDKN